MPAVKPEILRWARETAGMSSEEAASALQVKPVRLDALEGGKEEPSRSLLLRMSKQYRRSLLTFYLAAPPRRGDRGQDFRTLPPDRSLEDEAVLDALIRDLKSRQGLVRSIMKDEEEISPLRFVGSRKMSDGVESVVRSITTTLQLNLDEYRAQDGYDSAFASLRDRAEAAGIFVQLVGDLGSHHSAIPVEIFRGFAIADEYAPFVVINNQDARPAWSFTLLHEIAHLWLGTTGISGARAEKDIEQFCNDVAEEFLLPTAELRSLAATDETSADKSIARDYYTVRRHRVGETLMNLVKRSVNAGVLSPVRAAKVLGVKPCAVYPLLADCYSFDESGSTIALA